VRQAVWDQTFLLDKYRIKSKAKSLRDREPKRPDVDPPEHIWLNYRYGARLEKLLESTLIQTWLWHSYDYDKTALTLGVEVAEVQAGVLKIYSSPVPKKVKIEKVKVKKKRGRPLKISEKMPIRTL